MVPQSSTRTARARPKLVLLVPFLLVGAGLLGGCNAILGYAEGESRPAGAGGFGGGSTVPTGGAGATSGGGGSGAAIGGEQCLNGVDDDGDALADCADPKCTDAGFACLPMPADHQPTFYLSRPVASPGASCPGGFSRQVRYRDLTYDPLDCTCGCDEPGSAICSITGDIYTQAGCSGISQTLHVGCNAVSGADSYQGQVTYDGPGSCQATTEPNGVPATGWSTAFDLCVADLGGAGCSADEVCTAPLPAGFEPTPCYLVSETVGCEAAFEQVETLGSEEVVDDRQCTTAGCNCAPAVGQSCQGRAGVVTSGLCGRGGIYVGKALGPCEPIGSSTELYVEQPTSNGGYCPSSGSGTASGEVHAADSYSLCCRP